MKSVFKIMALVLCEAVLTFTQMLAMVGLSDVFVSSGVIVRMASLIAMITVLSVSCAGTYWITVKIADIILDHK